MEPVAMRTRQSRSKRVCESVLEATDQRMPSVLDEVEALRKTWLAPQLVAKSSKAVRPDQRNTIDASEYIDDMDTLRSKAKAVALLLRASTRCVTYTGAGISKSSGIADYATKAVDSVAKSGVRLRDPLRATPTLAHDCLATIYRAGLIKSFINQNHDGLFEKAGVSVAHSNLIHGDWYDIANPVVQFSENLRSDLFNRLLEDEKHADLVLVAGTSLSGMNADRVATTSAARYQAGVAGILGMVLVNLQRTALDEGCTIRVFCLTDDFFPLVLNELGLELERRRVPNFEQNVFEVPYNENGKLVSRADGPKRLLDLSEGSIVKVVNPRASNFGRTYRVYGKRDHEGNWKMIEADPQDVLGRKPYVDTLGRWYVAAAINGEIQQLPIMSVDLSL